MVEHTIKNMSSIALGIVAYTLIQLGLKVKVDDLLGSGLYIEHNSKSRK
jgi:hypothetical protein